MGDRVLFQVYSSKSQTFGPIIYCHWSGEAACRIVNRLINRMSGRVDDVEYTSAQLLRECMAGTDENYGFGISNTDRMLTKADSHGDAGIVLIDCANNFNCTAFGGYLRSENGKLLK